MARRKSSDNLQRAARVSIQRMTKYVKIRPQFRYYSLRIQRMNFLLADDHSEFIDQAYETIHANSLAANLVGGSHILLVIREKLIKHAKDLKANKILTTPSADHLFEPIKTKNEVHPMCPIKRKLPQQVEFLQIVAAEMEAIAQTLFMEKQLLKQGSIVKDQMIGTDHVIFKLNPQIEKCLNDLRMIHLS